MNSIIQKLEITNSLIILDKSSKDKIEKSSRNIPNVKVTDVNHFSAYDIIKFKKSCFYWKFSKRTRKEIFLMIKIHLYDKILSPMVTEKSTNLSELNKICF